MHVIRLVLLLRRPETLARDALTAGKDLVDDACAKKAVAEQTAHEVGIAHLV